MVFFYLWGSQVFYECRDLIDYGVINKICLCKNISILEIFGNAFFSFLQDKFQKSVVKSVVKIHLKVRMRTCCKKKNSEFTRSSYLPSCNFLYICSSFWIFFDLKLSFNKTIYITSAFIS